MEKNKMPVARIDDFHAAGGREKALRELHQSVISVNKEAAGCQRVELLVYRKDTAHLVIVEKWDDVVAHQAAAQLIPPSKLAGVAPLLAEPPKGRYFDLG